MLQKGCYSAKIKSTKTILTVFPQKFTPSKYIHYTVYYSSYQYNKTDTMITDC